MRKVWVRKVMASKEPFEGKGFDRDPLTGDENASHREMFHKVRDAWPTDFPDLSR